LLGSEKLFTLYLRPFRDDETHDIRTPYKALDRLINWLIYAVDWIIDDSVSSEEKLISGFETCGPVLAIGRPGEWLPPLGACRLYVDDQHWQEVVHDLIRRSACVLIRLGRTDGLRWELQEAARLLMPEQLVLYLPLGGGWFRGDRQKHYEKLREWADECLPLHLPELIGNACVIYFDAGWDPHLLGPCRPLEPSSFSLAGSHPFAGPLASIVEQKDLQPERAVFDQTGFFDIAALTGKERLAILLLLVVIFLALTLRWLWLN
jgi:hypothetical protein